MRKFKLAICQFPGNATTKPGAPGWLLKVYPSILNDPNIELVIPFRKSDTPIDMVRNLAVKTVKAMGADYILMIDQDMEPDSEPDGKPFWDVAWKFMMDRRCREEEARSSAASCGGFLGDKPPGADAALEKIFFRDYPPATIAAPYCGPPPNEVVYVFKWINYESNTPNVNFNLEVFSRDQAARFTGISEVAALPTGLILYDARLFDHLPAPWFAYEFKDPPFNTEKASTEDVYQTRNASLIGMPQHCAWDCWAAHIKDKTVRKPVPYTVGSVPDIICDAIKAGGIRGDHRVQFIRGDNDQISRPTTAPAYSPDSVEKLMQAKSKLAGTS